MTSDVGVLMETSAAGSPEVTWIVVALTFVTMAKNVADGVLNWLTKRDQLRFDYTQVAEKAAATEAKLEEIQRDLLNCRDQHEESNTDREDLRAKNLRLQEQMLAVQNEVAELKRKWSNSSNI